MHLFGSQLSTNLLFFDRVENFIHFPRKHSRNAFTLEARSRNERKRMSVRHMV